MLFRRKDRRPRHSCLAFPPKKLKCQHHLMLRRLPYKLADTFPRGAIELAYKRKHLKEWHPVGHDPPSTNNDAQLPKCPRPKTSRWLRNSDQLLRRDLGCDLERKVQRTESPQLWRSPRRSNPIFELELSRNFEMRARSITSIN